MIVVLTESVTGLIRLVPNKGSFDELVLPLRWLLRFVGKVVQLHILNVQSPILVLVLRLRSHRNNLIQFIEGILVVSW